jgi:hypothetical protein
MWKVKCRVGWIVGLQSDCFSSFPVSVIMLCLFDVWDYFHTSNSVFDAPSNMILVAVLK